MRCAGTSISASDFALLDVGSNRGSFARAFLEAAPNANIVGRRAGRTRRRILRRTCRARN